jgi:hypothetical protein
MRFTGSGFRLELRGSCLIPGAAAMLPQRSLSSRMAAKSSPPRLTQQALSDSQERSGTEAEMRKETSLALSHLVPFYRR